MFVGLVERSPLNCKLSFTESPKEAIIQLEIIKKGEKTKQQRGPDSYFQHEV